MLRTGRPLALRLLALLPMLALIAGCSDDMKKSLGLGKNAPDEFAVVRRAPLSLPPEFTLRPPQPGAVRPQEGSATDQARNAVLGQSTDQAASAPPVAAPPPVDPPPTPSPRTPVAAGRIGGPAPRTPQPASPPPRVAPPGPVPMQAAVPQAPAPVSAGPSRGEQIFLKAAGADTALPNIRAMIAEDLTKLATADDRFIDKLLIWRKNEAPAAVLDAQKESQRLQENAALGKPATDGQTPTIKRKSKGILEGLF